MLENFEAPATKKDLLIALGLVALTIWLSDSKGVEQGVKELRQRLGGLIAGKTTIEADPKP